MITYPRSKLNDIKHPVEYQTSATTTSTIIGLNQTYEKFFGIIFVFFHQYLIRITCWHFDVMIFTYT